LQKKREVGGREEESDTRKGNARVAFSVAVLEKSCFTNPKKIKHQKDHSAKKKRSRVKGKRSKGTPNSRKEERSGPEKEMIGGGETGHRRKLGWSMEGISSVA